jgi:hypothetical protein
MEYSPVKSQILPITEMFFGSDFEGTKIKTYVSLSDSSGSQVKTPGIFRFELFEFIPRSSESKGKRLFIWPDMDLREIGQNNKHWRDFLRAYEFELFYEKGRIQRAILEVTCICPNEKRLSCDSDLKSAD